MMAMKEDYDKGWEVACERCSAKFLRFHGLNDAGLCTDCFREAFHKYLESMKNNREQPPCPT